jgi:branched-chain amino acid transport system substrate-binding protein
MTRMRCLSGTALVAVVLSLAACTSEEPERAAGPGGEVKIGVLAPRSGESRAAGVEAQQGAELAVALVNGEAGSVALAGAGAEGLGGLGGAKLAIVAGDTRSDPVDGAAEAARLVTEERVVGLVGAYDTVVTEAASQRTERLRVPFVNGDSPAIHLSQRGLDWFFRTGPTDRMFGEAFFSALREIAGSGADRVAAVYANDRPSNVLANLTEELATEGGFGLTPEPWPTFEPGTSPVGAVAQLRALPQQPDAVFAIASTPKDASALLKAFGQAGYSPPGILAFGAGFLPGTVLNAGQDGEGLLTSTAWSREIAGRSSISKSVMELYEERFSRPMSDIAAGTFTAVLVLAQAIDNAGSTDPQRVRAALLSLDIPGREMIMPWSGVRFDAASHQNVAANGVIEQRVEDALRVVFPGELQRAEPVWPRPATGAAA